MPIIQTSSTTYCLESDRSHTLAVWSPLPVARVVPSGLKATQ